MLICTGVNPGFLMGSLPIFLTSITQTVNHIDVKRVINLHGTNGDITTSAIAVNAIRNTHKAAPGVVTMRDLPIVSIF